MHSADDVDALLKARAEIDEQLRRHKNALTVLFTDVVGSTSYFDRNGDTAGLVMIHRHDELAAQAIEQHGGKVVKTIGDSAMAEFPDAASAVRAAVEIEREFLKFNSSQPENQRVDIRIGIHTGVGFRKGNDLFGDVVNVTARIVKHTAPAQILISRATYESISKEVDLRCRWLNKLTIDGRTEKEDIFEVVWSNTEAYRVQERVTSTSHIPPRYEVLSQIGSGGTGIVYKVRDQETGEIVALKILKPEIASDPEAQENFKRELCLARKITHKNVCRIHEFTRLNGMAYTSMELIEGESLSSKLYRAGALTVTEALDIARQICAGLREAHAQGIVHRDLKPANIMLDRKSTVKIMDFGIARMVHREGPMTGTIVGTPAYMAPEQADLKPVNSCTDIYATGLLLYEMVTGVPAFSGDSPVAVAIKQIRDYPKRPREIVPQLSRAIEAVIMRCLQKDPARRFQSADALDNALVKAAKARPLSPWEAALNRWGDIAEAEVRKRVHEGMEAVEKLFDQKDISPPVGIQHEPKAILGMAGMAGALTVFLFLGGWKTNTISAQTVPSAGQNSRVFTPAAGGFAPASTSPSAEMPASPIISRNVSLYEDAKPEGLQLSPSAEDSSTINLNVTHVGTTDAPANPAPKPKQAKLAAQADKPKSRKNVPSSASAQTLASTAPTESIVASNSPGPATLAPVATPTESINAPEPVVDAGSAAAQHKTIDGEAKILKLYVEVGTFKEETWAISAVDKLTQLGFHAVLVHKNLLWVQSYHVQVGPYANQKDLAEAQKDLATHGFKAHPVS
jgi:serine/threonine protein kinase/class 3 adenylate cyclase